MPEPISMISSVISQVSHRYLKGTSKDDSLYWRQIPMAGLAQERVMNTDWMRLGRCKDMDPAVFFPSDGVGVQAAQRVCAECVVRSPCLEYALVNKIGEGVWGGASERQRKRLLGQRRRQDTSSAHPTSSVRPTLPVRTTAPVGS